MWRRMLRNWLKNPPRPTTRPRWNLVQLEDRAVPAVITFQQGLDPVDETSTPIAGAPVYLGGEDAQLNSKAADSTDGGVGAVSIDQQNSGGIQTQVVIAFNEIFGNQAGKVPFGSKINSATLNVLVDSSTNLTSFVSFGRMLTPWSQDTATWNFFSSTAGGLQTDDIELSSVVDAILPADKLGSGINVDFTMTDTVQAWAAGVPNFGWGIYQFGGNGWDFISSEGPEAERPKLTIDFTPPSGAGEFSFSQPTYTTSEGNTGTKIATIDIYRTVGDAGEAKVDVGLAVSAGTATLASDYNFTPSTITFASGVRTKTVSFEIVGDTAIEGPETINFALTNATGGATISGTKGSTTFTIGDNDALINEVFFDPVGDDATLDGFEFAELIGTPGAKLGSIGGKDLYFISVDGDSGVNGLVDISVDLSTATFGSNGLLLLRPTKFAYDAQVPTATNQVIIPGSSINAFENPTVSYLLVLSDAAIPIGTNVDPDGNGVIDFPTGVNAIVLDQIGTTDGGSSDLVVGTGGAGVRVSQGDGNPDAVSRFNALNNNDLIPLFNAAWYSGDVFDNSGLAYNIPTDPTTFGKATPNTPQGALVTPGDLNIPRAFAFEPTNVTVNEALGKVTLNVQRLGDASGKASVDFSTADGTAKAGLDYTAANGTVTFDVGETNQQITITINNETLPEGFETLFVNLSNPTGGFQISAKTSTILIEDDDSIVATFQDGVNNYTSTQDVGLFGWGPNDTFGSDLAFSVDQSDQGTATQGLIKFEDIFGLNQDQVPTGATIHGGVLTFFVTSPSGSTANIRFYEMLQDWNEGLATWGSPNATIVNGVTPDDVEARSYADFQVPTPGFVGFIDMIIPADTLQAWANGAPNFGWMINTDSGDGWDFLTTEVTNTDLRPKLSVIYSEPTGAGDFRIERPAYSVGESVTTTTFNISRVGGSTGSATVEYSLSGLTATAAADFTASGGIVTFPDGVVSLPITVSILTDNLNEANETFEISLSNPSTGSTILAGGASAIVTLRDDDAPAGLVLNEININPPGNDQPFEFVELLGANGAGLGNVYLVSLEGDSGGDALITGTSPARGVGEIVFDFSSKLNGTNGVTIATPTVGGFTIPAGTTVLASPFLDTGSGRTLQNGTQSFLLVYSPDATITPDTFDFDWNNDGILDLPDGATVLDAINVSQENLGDLVYPATGATVTLTGIIPDALTRVVGNSASSDATAWYGGDLLGTESDTRAFNAANSTANLPAGAVTTPGAANFVANTAPDITSNGGGATASVNVTSGTTAVTTVTFNDPDLGQPFAFTLSGPDAALFGITPAGVLTFLAPPDFNAPGDVGGDNIYDVSVTLSDGVASDVQDLAVTVVAAPAVTGIVVNNAETQRSRLTQIVVGFGGMIDASAFQNPGAVSLTRTTATSSGTVGTVVDLTSGLAIAPLSGLVSSITLTFEDISTSGVEFGSLADGRWQLAIPLSNYLSPLDDTDLRRLFGDINADGTVDGPNDFAGFGTIFGSTPGIGGSAFDFNNDGTIDGSNDFASFGVRFGITL